MSDALAVLVHQHGTLGQVGNKERLRWENETIDSLGRMHREYLRCVHALTCGAKLSPRARAMLERRIEFYGAQSDRLEKKLDAHIRRMVEFYDECARLVERKTCAMLPASVIPSGYDEHGTGDGLHGIQGGGGSTGR